MIKTETLSVLLAEERQSSFHILSTFAMAFPRFMQAYRSCLFQIIIVGLVAFCEPGIWTALNNLGAGGNASVGVHPSYIVAPFCITAG